MKNFARLLLAIFILVDIIFSFYQHRSFTLDGDMAKIILAVDGYEKVLQDPFGYQAIFQKKKYPGPNRFFAHQAMYAYFRTMPFLLQNLGFSAIESIYNAAGLAKTFIQIGLIYLISILISRTKSFWRKEFLLAAILISPLFQTFGFNNIMGIIDKSITYTFFMPSLCFGY